MSYQPNRTTNPAANSPANSPANTTTNTNTTTAATTTTTRTRHPYAMLTSEYMSHICCRCQTRHDYTPTYDPCWYCRHVCCPECPQPPAACNLMFPPPRPRDWQSPVPLPRITGRLSRHSYKCCRCNAKCGRIMENLALWCTGCGHRVCAECEATPVHGH